MNPMFAFVGLLLLSYLGSVLVGNRAVRGYGLPSGSEYLLLGAAVGPVGLGLLELHTLERFAPLLHAGAGWLLLLTGLDWAAREGAAPRPWPVIRAALLSLVTLGCVAAGVYFVASWTTNLPPETVLLLSLSLAAVGVETTGIAVRWVFERHGADGPLARAIRVLTDSDDVPAVLLAAWVFCLLPRPEGAFELPTFGWFGLTLAIGAVLGVTCQALMGKVLHLGEATAFVVGAALFGIGLSVHLGLAAGAALFVLGFTLSAFSPHRAELRRHLHLTEQPVLLPVLLLAGALVNWASHPAILSILLAALFGRVVGKLLTGLAVFSTPRGRPGGPGLGLGLMSSGVVSLSLALTLSLRMDDTIGDIILTVAVALAVFGELVGPFSLKRALTRAGEVRDGAEAKVAPEETPA